jgi:hypothetical protein
MPWTCLLNYPTIGSVYDFINQEHLSDLDNKYVYDSCRWWTIRAWGDEQQIYKSYITSTSNLKHSNLLSATLSVCKRKCQGCDNL